MYDSILQKSSFHIGDLSYYILNQDSANISKKVIKSLIVIPRIISPGWVLNYLNFTYIKINNKHSIIKIGLKATINHFSYTLNYRICDKING
jgi:hypothetical protein